MNQRADLFLSLQNSGVFPGNGTKKLEMATQLEKLGVTAEQVDYLFRCAVEASDSRSKATGLFLKWLSPDHVQQTIADMKLAESKYDEVKAKVEQDKAVYPGQGLWKEPGQRLDHTDATWERRRQAQIAYCRVVSDRKSYEEVSSEMQIPIDTLKELVEEGKAIVGWQPLDKVPKMTIVARQLDKTADQIRAEYQERVKSAKVV